MINLPVTYKSQWDADASDTRDDCGPACISMTLDFYGVKKTINDVFKKTGAAANALISISQMSTAISAYGYTAKYLTNQSFDQLKAYLDRQVPVIALVHYGDFTSRQDKGFAGGHFFLVVGYRDDGVFVNDPDFWGTYRQDGDHHFYTMTDFMNGWRNASKDGNPTTSFLVFEPKEQQTVMLPKPDFERMVKEGTAWREMCAYFQFPGEPQDTQSATAISVIGGYKSQITTLQTRASTAEAEVANREQQVERIKQTMEESAKQAESRQNELSIIISAKDKTIESQGTRIHELEAQVDAKAKEIGSLNITIANLKANVLSSLSIYDALVIIIGKLIPFLRTTKLGN